MTTKEFAALLNGRNYGNELTRTEEKQAEELGFVIVFGASDDLMEFCGAINDEIGVCDGGTAYLADGEVFEGCSEGFECKFVKAIRARAKTIEAVWDDKEAGCAWSYKTEIPHETFKIYEDGELYCIGIVFDIEEVRG